MSLDRIDALLDVAIDAALDGDVPAYLRIQQRMLAEAGGEHAMYPTLDYLIAGDPDGHRKLVRIAEKTRYLVAVGVSLYQQAQQVPTIAALKTIDCRGNA